MRDGAHPSQLVSVVIPTKNRRQSLRRAVDSVLAQTHRDLEVIIVDDGSTDGTGESVSQLSDARVTLIRLDDCQGASAARNLGIGAAKGEWVAFLDDDDYWLPTKTELQLLALEKEPGARVSYCRRLIAGASGLAEHPRSMPSGDVLQSMAAGDLPVSTPCLMAHRSLLTDVLFDPALKRYQDFDLFLGLASVSNFVAVDVPLVVTTQDQPGKITHDQGLRKDAWARIEQKWAPLLEQRGYGREFAALCRRVSWQNAVDDTMQRRFLPSIATRTALLLSGFRLSSRPTRFATICFRLILGRGASHCLARAARALRIR